MDNSIESMRNNFFKKGGENMCDENKFAKVFRKFFIVVFSMMAFVLLPLSIAHAGQCGHYAYYDLDDRRNLKIYSYPGKGEIAEYFNDKYLWITSRTVDVQREIIKIPAKTFEGFTNLEVVVIADSVEEIGDDAFAGCTNLKGICLPKNFQGKTDSLGVPEEKICFYDPNNQKCGDNLNWVITDGGDMIIFGKGAMYDYVESTHPWDKSKVKTVEILNGATSIGVGAFDGCSKLESITIPDSVTSIGKSSFNGCSSLATITIPDSVTSIGEFAFTGCAKLNNVTVPVGVTSIGQSTFQNCSSLESIDIPEGVTSIGEDAFYGCSSLATVTIPDSVTSIGKSSFNGCSSLATITIPEGVTSIGQSTFQNCSSLKSIDIPEGVTSIGSSAFWGCSSLESIDIPEGVTSIGADAFYGCSSLATVTIPASVTSIGASAFKDCSSLATVTIPDTVTIPASVTSIGASAFESCSKLVTITIPASVTSIGAGAFHGCSSLKSITIPASVTNIGGLVFADCKKLNNVTIENGVPSISASAFKDCSSLATITIPDSVTSIGDSAFNGCSSLESIKKMDKVTSIGARAFKDCSSLAAVTIPASVTSIGASAFESCSSLESIDIPEGVTSIGADAFYGCSSLATVTIPASVTSIGDRAFKNCSSLATITIPEGVIGIGGYAFTDCSNLSIKLPYQFQSEVARIGALTTKEVIFYGKCGDNLTWTLNNTYGDLTISGAGAMQDYSIGNQSPWYYSSDSKDSNIVVKKIEFQDGVTHIGSYAFTGCGNLVEVTIPDSVTSIGASAFENCSSLTEIIIPASVATISDYAFKRCKKLNFLLLPEKFYGKRFGAPDSTIVCYVNDVGTTSTKVDKNDMIWLKEESGGKYTWYGLNNSGKQFPLGSKFWVRWLDKNADKAEYDKYYDQLDDKYKNDPSKASRIFLIGVVKPNGEVVTTFNPPTKLYIELGSEWDEELINAVFISEGEDEEQKVRYGKATLPDGTEVLVAIITLSHFSPYAVFEMPKDSQGESNETNAPEKGESLIAKTADTVMPQTMFALAGLLMLALAGLWVSLKKQRS